MFLSQIRDSLVIVKYEVKATRAKNNFSFTFLISVRTLPLDRRSCLVRYKQTGIGGVVYISNNPVLCNVTFLHPLKTS